MGVARMTVSGDRPGVDLHLFDGDGPVVSQQWTMGGWTLQFVRLDAGQQHPVDAGDGVAYVKVITGRLTEPHRVAYVAPRTIADTCVEGDHLTAGPDGAVVMLCVRTTNAPHRYTSMAQLVIDGPLAEHLTWSSFEARFAGILTAFDGLDAHLTPGFHLLDADGAGHGGMYETSAPGAPDRARLAVPTGFEHGPYFEFDDDGAPLLRENGAVVYPWHSWQGGDDGQPDQAYDVVIPFEITVPYARVTGS